MNLLVIGGLVAVVIALLIVRQKDSARKPARKAEVTMIQPSQTNSEFHAVSIRQGQRVCEAVKKLSGQRFLSKEAPMLPVDGCDITQCDCSYVHYRDRRSGKDRRSPFNSGGLSATTGKFQIERRENRERRREAEIPFF